MEFSANNTDYTTSAQFAKDWKHACKTVGDLIKPVFADVGPKLRCQPDIKTKDGWFKIQDPHSAIRLLAARFSRVGSNHQLDLRVWFYKDCDDAYQRLNSALPFEFNGAVLSKTHELTVPKSWKNQLDKDGIEVRGIQYASRQGGFHDEASIANGLGHLLKLFSKYLLQALEQNEPAAEANDLLADGDASQEQLIEEKQQRLQWVAQRQGQPAFRQALLDVYDNTCCISGTSVPDALEAAHIVPYTIAASNQVSNGLLLRADLHTLFDLGLISVCPDSYRVELADSLVDSDYAVYAGKTIKLPESAENKPSKAALLWSKEYFH